MLQNSKISDSSYYNLTTQISMTSKTKMINIKEQSQPASSISLNEGSVIEQYNELEFSDEKERSQQESSYGEELSVEKLKFLGVDKFPWKLKNKKEMKEEESEGIKCLSRNTVSMLSCDKNWGYYSRKQRNKELSYQAETKDQSFFNIDSFLNSQHPTKNQKLQQPYTQKYNRNPLEQIVQPHTKTKESKASEREPYMGNKYISKVDEEKNIKIKQYIKNSMKQCKQQTHKYSVSSQQQQSINLITLPQPSQQSVAAVNGRQNKKYKNKSQSVHHKSFTQQNNRNDDMMKIRFQQARMNFLDNFLPESLKIKNNAYNYWKYAHSKNSMLRIM